MIMDGVEEGLSVEGAVAQVSLHQERLATGLIDLELPAK
jgi:hypothetical protein